MTGDAVICSSNTSTGLGLKTLTSSMWNHSGIAIRVRSDGSISDDSHGRLLVMEINTWSRKDALTGKMVVGAGYSDFDWMSSRYNIVAVRPLRDQYRTPDFISRIPSFVDRHRGLPFTTDLGPFFSVLLGVPLHDNPTVKGRTMFCSEFMAYFYTECLGLTMSTIFGDEGPELPNLCTPEHFSVSSTPTSAVFEPTNMVVHVEHSDLGSVLIPILIFTFLMAVIVWTLLPHGSPQHQPWSRTTIVPFT